MLAAFSVCMTFCSLCSVAQSVQNRSVSVNEPDYNKPKLFGDLPDSINFDPTYFSALFNTQVGQSVTLSDIPGFTISGQVVFETAPSNSGTPGTWTQLYAESWNTSAIPLAAVSFELKAGTWRIEGNAPGTVVFDNFKAAKP